MQSTVQHSVCCNGRCGYAQTRGLCVYDVTRTTSVCLCKHHCVHQSGGEHCDTYAGLSGCEQTRGLCVYDTHTTHLQALMCAPVRRRTQARDLRVATDRRHCKFWTRRVPDNSVRAPCAQQVQARFALAHGAPCKHSWVQWRAKSLANTHLGQALFEFHGIGSDVRL